jgi:DHA2 family metal-tetracycline-proton antiporter-like MFS transporter
MTPIESASEPSVSPVNVKKLIPWIVYLIFFAVLNETMFNVSSPKIAEQFSLTPAGVSWMMTSFMIFFGIGSVIYGKLSDIFSLRRLILIGVLLYNAGSVMGFLVQTSYPLILLARALQGAGCSAIPALIFIVVARYFPAAERGKVFGLLTSTVSLAIGLGPVIGGFVSGIWSWSFLFLIPLFTLVSIPFFRKELPAEPRREGGVDVVGALLTGSTIGVLVVYLTFGKGYYLAAFMVLLMASILRMRSATNPFIEPKLFKNRPFRNGVLVGFALFSIVIGVLFLIPLMLHDVHGLSPSKIGLILFPGAMSSVLLGPFGGSLADRKGNSFVVLLGTCLMVVSFVLIALFLAISPWYVCGALLLMYVGFSLFQTALINSVSQTLPMQETGVGMGLFNLVGIIAGAVGTALVGKILAGKWLAFEVFSTGTYNKAAAYSNLILIFAVVVALGGLLYLRSYRVSSEGSILLPPRVQENPKGA